MNDLGKSVALWAVAAFGGWVLNGLFIFNILGLTPAFSALVVWAGLFALAAVATHVLVPKFWQKPLAQAWIAVILVGFVLAAVDAYGMLPPEAAAYVPMQAWILLTALGFGITAFWGPDRSRVLYGAGAVLNIILLAALVAGVPPVSQNAFWLAAIVVLAPLLLDAIMHHHASGPALPKPREQLVPQTVSIAPPAPPAESVPQTPKTVVTVAAVSPPATAPTRPAGTPPRKLIVRIAPKKME